MPAMETHRTLDDLVQIYLRERILRPDTAIRYQQVVRQFQNDMGVRTLDEIQRDTLLEWRSQVLQRARATTWNYYRRHFRAMWRFAMEAEWISHDPLERVDAAPEDRRIKTVSRDLLDQAIAALDDSENRCLEPRWFWLVVLLTFYYTGMRRRQLVALTWGDVCWNQNVLRLSVAGSKTHREWDIPVPAPLLEPLRELYDRTIALRGPRGLEHSQVFDLGLHRGEARYQGKGIRVEQVSGFFRKLSEVLGQPISPHRLRHTLGTEVGRQENPPLRALQHLLGHTNLSTTMQYVEPDMGQLRQLVDHLPQPGRS
ncbi:site-specific integrase [Thioalkalivibrio sp. ALMg11]|uniref:tyrosine-type recombinase/integrase n=1 Tax=Thioalkalivibrio sp. ALMg11 TaxID=1158165 RepID=UPI0003677353|nr:site-specific integrase [Thioalkalivibrio sp. ALMg11]